MKIERLSKGKNKKIVLAITILLFLMGIIYITNSKAKYQITKSVQIVNGNVNYSLADLNVIALKVQDSKGSENYILKDEVPIGNYEVNKDKSYCTYPGDNLEHKDISMEYKDNGVYIKITKKGTKCYVFLDVATTKKVETSLGILNVQLDTPNFDKTSCATGCEETTNGVFKGEENGQPTYYFRGSVSNNYVLFANMYWRIIRINSNGSIRMIYSGTTAGATGKATQLENGKTQTFSINSNTYNDNAYVGYKYGSTGQTQNLNGYNATHTNTNDSGIKSYIDSWYTNTLSKAKNNGKSATEYIDTEAGFCGDRTPYQYNGVSATSKSDKNNYGAGTTSTYYGAYIRTYRSPKKPTFDCPNADNDLYTVNSAKTGNHALTNPIGLITADEVNFAGGRDTSNSGYWLYTGEQGYWTMSPFTFNSGNAQVFFVTLNGYLNYNGVLDTNIGVRPVINLKADTKFTFTDSGAATTGTSTNPYKVS